MENSRYALMNDSLQFFSTPGNYQSAFIIVSSFLESHLQMLFFKNMERGSLIHWKYISSLQEHFTVDSWEGFLQQQILPTVCGFSYSLNKCPFFDFCLFYFPLNVNVYLGQLSFPLGSFFLILLTHMFTVKYSHLAIAIPTTQPPTIDQNPIQPASTC